MPYKNLEDKLRHNREYYRRNNPDVKSSFGSQKGEHRFVYFRSDIDTYEEMVLIAKREKRTMSSVVRDLIELGLETMKEMENDKGRTTSKIHLSNGLLGMGR